MPIAQEPLCLTPLEQYCFDYIQRIRRLRRRLSLALPQNAVAPMLLLPPPMNLVAPSGSLSISAAAEEDRPVHQPPSRSMKWIGEIAQVKFAAAAMSRNLLVALLLTDCVQFDSVVIAPKKIYTVQVKSTTSFESASWVVHLHRSASKGNERYYRRGDFDILAVMVPGDLWYLFPYEVVAGRVNLTLPRRPQLVPKKLAIPNIEQYREAWHIFE